jgi:hypothetical protein
MSGLRRGEALGPRWSDVDLERGETVARPARPHDNVRPAEDTEWREPQVELDAGTVGVLLGHQLRQQMERAEWGEAYEDHDQVFARENGAPLTPST